MPEQSLNKFTNSCGEMEHIASFSHDWNRSSAVTCQQEFIYDGETATKTNKLDLTPVTGLAHECYDT